MFHYNHNEHYTNLLLRQVPPGCRNALDVGCGDGSFAQRLADRFGIAVTGIDRDQAMIEQAQMTISNPLLRFVQANFLQYPFGEQFDFIAASASLHHMPFDRCLEEMVSLLQPGGVLAVLGLFREANLTDMGVALIAVPVNAFYALSCKSSPYKAPIRPADMSLPEIRERVSSILTDAHLRRLLLWRYLLTWQTL
ncbi:MAG TPA: class I SAM-dependent methyltransferase [Ktedonosporobacter sp.]|jgi:trans-aconitate methyltransferase|nr:class I SAM-dependent methyltransferase [Ktedonosporobacter sp.]